jgi:hypothetical protein
MMRMVMLVWLAAASATAADSAKTAEAPPKKGAAPLQMSNIKALVADGKHNAFPVLVSWKSAYWLAYRKAGAHNGPGDIVILRSTDADNWSEARRVDFGSDDRNAQWLATPERLFLYHAVTDGKRYQAYVSFTDDGQTWSQPQPAYEPQFVFWKPLEHKGRFYANAHRKAEGRDAGKIRESRLLSSTDGLKWETVVTVRKGNWESETTFYFGPNDHLYAFIRTKYSKPGHIMESDPPYQQWTERPAGTHFSGHCVRTFRGMTYLFSRHYGPQSRTSTMIYTFQDGKLTPYCQSPLNPTNGDCSYAEAVELGEEMLVCFYSSHEGATNIYLGRVPLRK